MRHVVIYNSLGAQSENFFVKDMTDSEMAEHLRFMGYTSKSKSTVYLDDSERGINIGNFIKYTKRNDL